jgi:hypothetical protein
MSNNIILKKSSVTSKVPLTTDLTFGELALNYADGKLYYKKADGTTIDSFDADITSSDVTTALGYTPYDASNPSGYTSNTGDVTLTDTQTLTNKTLNGAVLNDGYTEEVFAVTGTTPALSPADGSIQTWTLSANSTPTAGTWASGQSITLMVDDGTAYTVTWSSLAVTWKTDAGVAPTLNTSGYTAIALWKVDSTIYGARVGDA